jgi:hypothetical protein
MNSIPPMKKAEGLMQQKFDDLYDLFLNRSISISNDYLITIECVSISNI